MITITDIETAARNVDILSENPDDGVAYWVLMNFIDKVKQEHLENAAKVPYLLREGG